ncbi:Gfo/Idh/MocA family oxidoreductase [Coraliomargarita algicola]|uniref:Gfo/Idh/MocA family oxidoreductase n=1 Tax=Coraliomargarita algicola TaxID=3092156 RepID=A0ABZ0RJ22_9BACT|nr:Gfo/Idh/MocA family oxidoreductase [Coraliomargarita sp. J2-16]WPJ95259.1 Gfo/Idh/MocA family oxidoreductase [Coraliomargarita sp. J2-16]
MTDTIKVGIWGLGRAGLNMHAAELGLYPEQFELHSGIDIDPARNQILVEKYGAKAYTNEDAFLNDPEVELISIATRSPDHVAHCERALSAGKYVFLEKPIGLSYTDGLKILALSQQYPGKLYPRQNRRFEAPFNHIKEIMASGILGDVYEIKLCRHSFQRRSDWQTIVECGGGQLNNWGPHIIDHALQFLDYKVAEIWSDLKKVAALGNAEDHIKIVLKGESGRVIDMEISGGAALPQNEYTLFGTRGALTCQGADIHLKYIDPDQEFQKTEAFAGTPSLDGGVSNAYADLEPVKWVEEHIKVAPQKPTQIHSIWPALYDSVRNNAKFPVSIEQAVAVLKVTDQVKKNTSFS